MILKNIFICDGEVYKKTNILLDENLKYIKEIDCSISSNKKIIDCTNKNILTTPSIFDTGIRAKNNKLTKKHILKLMSKCEQNGIKDISILPDCSNTQNNPLIIEMMGKNKNIFPLCNAVKDDTLAQIATLYKFGARGIYIDSYKCKYLKQIFQYSKINNMKIFANCFDKDFSFGHMHNGEIASSMGLDGLDSIAQDTQVAQLLQLGYFYKSDILFNNIYSIRSIDIIKEQSNSHIQTPIHHLVLSDKECKNFNTNAKIFPPLTDEKTREILIQRLIDKKINSLTSLQCKDSILKKDLPFEDASFAVDEIDKYFSICYTYLVKNKIIDMKNLINLLSNNIRNFLNKEKILIQKNQTLDNLIFIDLDTQTKVNNKYSLYNNHILYSSILNTKEFLSS